jgi:hypothetical protein
MDSTSITATLSATGTVATHDVNTMLANAVPAWVDRARTHFELANEIRRARDERLQTMIGGNRDIRERMWRAEEARALEHLDAFATWETRIKAATEAAGGMLLSDGDPAFQGEFRALYTAATEAGRVRYVDRRQTPQPSFLLAVPRDL